MISSTQKDLLHEYSHNIPSFISEITQEEISSSTSSDGNLENTRGIIVEDI